MLIRNSVVRVYSWLFNVSFWSQLLFLHFKLVHCQWWGKERCCSYGEWGLLGGADENGKAIDHCERQAGKAHTIQKAILLLSNSPSETLTQYKGDLRRWPLSSFVHLFIYPGHSQWTGAGAWCTTWEITETTGTRQTEIFPLWGLHSRGRK